MKKILFFFANFKKYALFKFFYYFQIPFSLTLRVWDLYLLEGERVLIAMAYTILWLHRRKLMKMQMDDGIEYLQIMVRSPQWCDYGWGNFWCIRCNSIDFHSSMSIFKGFSYSLQNFLSQSHKNLGTSLLKKSIWKCFIFWYFEIFLFWSWELCLKNSNKILKNPLKYALRVKKL